MKKFNIGILSDSHGDSEITRRAVSVLLAQDVDMLIHLGDIGNEAVIDALACDTDANGNLKPPVHLVFGNTDWDAILMENYAKHLGIKVDHPVGRLSILGKSLIFHHGHDAKQEKLAIEQNASFFLHGHTHRTRDELINQTRMINPGALHRAKQYTVAILDVATEQLNFMQVT